MEWQVMGGGTYSDGLDFDFSASLERKCHVASER